MNFVNAVKSGKRFRPAGSQVFYERVEIGLMASGNRTRMVSISELDARDWEVEEPTVVISQSDLIKAVNRATTLASVSGAQADVITIQMKKDFNLDDT